MEYTLYYSSLLAAVGFNRYGRSFCACDTYSAPVARSAAALMPNHPCSPRAWITGISKVTTRYGFSKTALFQGRVQDLTVCPGFVPDLIFSDLEMKIRI